MCIRDSFCDEPPTDAAGDVPARGRRCADECGSSAGRVAPLSRGLYGTQHTALGALGGALGADAEGALCAGALCEDGEEEDGAKGFSDAA